MDQLVEAPHDNLQLVLRHAQTEVLFQPASKQLVLRRSITPPSLPLCPLCKQLLPVDPGVPNEPIFESTPPAADKSVHSKRYFNLLLKSLQNTPVPSRPATPTGSRFEDHQLHEDSFVNGYYDRFFVPEKSLGRGDRGNVFLVRHVLDRQSLGNYACKIISVGNSSRSLINTLREIKHLETLRHPNIIDYHHSWLEMHSPSLHAPSVPHLFLLMSFANGGSLESFVAARRHTDDSVSSNPADELKRRFKAKRMQSAQPGVHLLRIDEILTLFRDICSGLEFLHEHNILHLDLKSENVLLHYDDLDSLLPTCLLSDFGSSDTRTSLSKRQRGGATGTLDWVPREALQCDPTTGRLRPLDATADLWSLGLLLYFLCFFRLPYQHNDVDMLKQEILEYKGYQAHDLPRQDLPFQLERIMTLLINVDPKKRLSASNTLAMIEELLLVDGKNQDPFALVKRPSEVEELPIVHAKIDTVELREESLISPKYAVLWQKHSRSCLALSVAFKIYWTQNASFNIRMTTLAAICFEIIAMTWQTSLGMTLLVAFACTLS